MLLLPHDVPGRVVAIATLTTPTHATAQISSRIRARPRRLRFHNLARLGNV